MTIALQVTLTSLMVMVLTVGVIKLWPFRRMRLITAAVLGFLFFSGVVGVVGGLIVIIWGQP